jgi:predicted metalloprotease with PDZ domain
VTIISAPTTFKSSAQNRLHEQLRHELFHLWIPNSLNLSGNYDWFYEGFALYKALKTGVYLNQIRFDDFLSTLGRAFDLTEALSRRRTVSLIEASEKRWINANELIYAKGIVVAFLCDAALLRESRGKRDLDSIFREVFQKHRAPNPREDGNAAILRILKSNPELVPLAENYIEGNSKVDWQNDLQSFGISAEKTSGATDLKVNPKPNGRQKDLLNKLGYNQWRKLLQKNNK